MKGSTLLRTLSINGFPFFDETSEITAIDFVQVSLGERTEIGSINFIEIALLVAESQPTSVKKQLY